MKYTVKAGPRSVELGSSDGTYKEYPLVQSAGSDEISVYNHDIRSIHNDGSHIIFGTKLGITIVDFTEESSTHYQLPQGHDLHDMVVLDDHIVLMTESGTWIKLLTTTAHCLPRPHGIISLVNTLLGHSCK